MNPFPYVQNHCCQYGLVHIMTIMLPPVAWNGVSFILQVRIGKQTFVVHLPMNSQISHTYFIVNNVGTEITSKGIFGLKDAD